MTDKRMWLDEETWANVLALASQTGELEEGMSKVEIWELALGEAQREFEEQDSEGSPWLIVGLMALIAVGLAVGLVTGWVVIV